MASQIGSFVFFDLETTGLFTPAKSPKITEISLIACSSQHLLETTLGELPRVLHKQTFCLNPRRTIDHGASKVSALYNDMLENESKFDGNIVQLMVLFLQRLQGPTCLVAHNGDRFDFIVLKKELADLNAQLPDNTYCVDSLPLFRALDGARDPRPQPSQQSWSWSSKSFRLISIHERLLGHPPKQSHYAECDVEALLKCAIAEGSGFVEHAATNMVKFRDFSANCWTPFEAILGMIHKLCHAKIHHFQPPLPPMSHFLYDTFKNFHELSRSAKPPPLPYSRDVIRAWPLGLRLIKNAK